MALIRLPDCISDFSLSYSDEIIVSEEWPFHLLAQKVWISQLYQRAVNHLVFNYVIWIVNLSLKEPKAFLPSALSVDIAPEAYWYELVLAQLGSVVL